MHMQLWKLAPSANCRDKAAGISVIGFATGFPYSVCVRDCALDVAFQIAKFVAFFTIENKHEHHQTAANCKSGYNLYQRAFDIQYTTIIRL